MELTLRDCLMDDLDFIFELKKIVMKWYIEKLYV